jgi:hypothetical protein
MWSYRGKFFLVHLLGSTLVLSAVLLALYLGWYGWPAWYLEGAELIVGLMVLVDLGLGPIATLVVANPGKARRKLQLDMTLIILVQLSALAYGTHTLWVGRPLYYVFSASQVEVVVAADIEERDVDVARERGNPLAPHWYSTVRWVWARMPEDPQEFGRLLMERLLAGQDVIHMPQYFRPLPEAAATMGQVSVSPRFLLGSSAMTEAQLEQFLAAIGRPEGAVGVLPLAGRTRQGAMVFDRATGEPLAYWPVMVPRPARTVP